MTAPTGRKKGLFPGVTSITLWANVISPAITTLYHPLPPRLLRQRDTLQQILN